MPRGKGFASKRQWRKCFALAAQGKAGTWDCRKWAHETPGAAKKRYRALPAKKRLGGGKGKAK